MIVYIPIISPFSSFQKNAAFAGNSAPHLTDDVKVRLQTTEGAPPSTRGT